jgi:hypothetical protein
MKPNLKKLAALTLAAPLVGCATEERQNVVLFLIDDMGWADSSLSFGEHIYPRNQIFETQNIERLAQTLEDYELLTSALWDAYNHEVKVLKELCIKHNIDKGTMLKLFKGGVSND